MADTILHNQPEGTPSDNELIAYGTPTTPAGNIKLSNFYNLLMGKLGFFKVSNLFSEIFGNPTLMASARANISVPSILEMQTADNLKANKSNVIEKDSSVDFTPTIGTHPTNKKYVDSKLRAGSVTFVTIGQGQSYMAVVLNPPFSDTNYSVSPCVRGTDAPTEYGYPIVDNKTQNGFNIKITKLSAGVSNNFIIDWSLIKY